MSHRHQHQQLRPKPDNLGGGGVVGKEERKIGKCTYINTLIKEKKESKVLYSNQFTQRHKRYESLASIFLLLLLLVLHPSASLAAVTKLPKTNCVLAKFNCMHISSIDRPLDYVNIK